MTICVPEETATVKLYVQAETGVPKIVASRGQNEPVHRVGTKLSPAGREPFETHHELEPLPPDADRVVEYAVPAVAGGIEVVVIESGIAAATVEVAAATVVVAIVGVIKVPTPAEDRVGIFDLLITSFAAVRLNGPHKPVELTRLAS